MFRLKVFKDGAAVSDAVVALLRGEFAAPAGARAVMLAGGSTPMAAYARIAAEPFSADAGLRIFFSDDRHVPAESAKSNFGNTRPLLGALGIGEDRVARVHGELPLAESVARFDADLRKLLDDCAASVGLLGLGADGHTASLFSRAHVEAGRGTFAVGVDRPDGMQGVSVTADVLAKVGKIIFLVTGAEKREMLANLLRPGSEITAALAVAGNRDVEIWADAAAAGR